MRRRVQLRGQQLVLRPHPHRSRRHHRSTHRPCRHHNRSRHRCRCRPRRHGLRRRQCRQPGARGQSQRGKFSILWTWNCSSSTVRLAPPAAIGVRARARRSLVAGKRLGPPEIARISAGERGRSLIPRTGEAPTRCPRGIDKKKSCTLAEQAADSANRPLDQEDREALRCIQPRWADPGTGTCPPTCERKGTHAAGLEVVDLTEQDRRVQRNGLFLEVTGCAQARADSAPLVLVAALILRPRRGRLGGGSARSGGRLVVAIAVLVTGGTETAGIGVVGAALARPQQVAVGNVEHRQDKQDKGYGAYHAPRPYDQPGGPASTEPLSVHTLRVGSPARSTHRLPQGGCLSCSCPAPGLSPCSSNSPHSPAHTFALSPRPCWTYTPQGSSPSRAGRRLRNPPPWARMSTWDTARDPSPPPPGSRPERPAHGAGGGRLAPDDRGRG